MAVKKLEPAAARTKERKTSAKQQAKLMLATNDPAKQFDELIHERTRLAIVSTLAVNPRLTFKDLKSLLGLSDGNLSAHARKLEKAGYIDCRKSFEGRMPRTDYRLNGKGRKALERYVEHMESLITTVKKS